MTPLRRNRDFVLLMGGQLLSTAGSQVSTVAYPLLVLAITHSPAKAGLVGFARFAPIPLFSVFAGVIADRRDRKSIMIAADGVRVIAIGALCVVVLSAHPIFWPIPVLAFIEGIGIALFGAAQPGAIRSVVAAAQLPAAISVQRARQAVVLIAGPPMGGVLFNLARALPFFVDALSYAFSFVSLLAIRRPFQEERIGDPATVRTDIKEGFRFLWGQPFLRTTTFLYAIGNFTLPGIFLVIVVTGRNQGLSGGGIGILFAIFAAFLLLGSLASPLFRKRLSMRAILVLELWLWLGSGLFLIWPNVFVLLAGILAQAIVMPVTDSAVVGYRIAITPDRMVGRVESVRMMLAQVATPLGPLAAGLLLSSLSARATVAVFVASNVVLALWGSFSRAIRDAPRLEEISA